MTAHRHPRTDPHRFVSTLKRWTVGLVLGGAGLIWGLVSFNVVGATNAAADTQAVIPDPDYFGVAADQPQPALGSGGVTVARSHSS
jgi:hypothetical protein